MLLGLSYCFLTQQMYVTIKVTIAVAVSVMMKVTANVIVATAPLDNKSDPEILDSHN